MEKLKYHHNPSTPKDTILKAEKALENVLKNREKRMGIGGPYSVKFEILLEKPSAVLLPLLTLTDLTKATAKQLFDLIDEQNTRTPKDQSKYKVSILKNNQEIDYNYLPNATTIYHP